MYVCLSYYCFQIGLKHTAEPMEEEPQTKKLRTEDSLIPEQQFLARNKVFYQQLWFLHIQGLLYALKHTFYFFRDLYN